MSGYTDDLLEEGLIFMKNLRILTYTQEFYHINACFSWSFKLDKQFEGFYLYLKWSSTHKLSVFAGFDHTYSLM